MDQRSGIANLGDATAGGGAALHPVTRLWRFGLVGFASTLIHTGTASALHYWLGLSPLWANGLGFLAALVASFYGQTRLTFPEAAADGAAFLRFAAVAVMGLTLSQLIVWTVTGPLGWPFWLGLAIVVTTVPIATFTAFRFWALRR